MGARFRALSGDPLAGAVVIGHRGAAGLAAENTVGGLMAARVAGCRAVEFDVRLAADGVPVLFHDPCLRRIAGLPLAPESLTAEELAAIGRAVHPDAEPIPTLEEALLACRVLELVPVVELKAGPVDGERLVLAVLAVLERAWLRTWPLPTVTSFDAGLLAAVKRRAPDLPLALNLHGIPDDLPDVLVRTGARSLHVAERLLEARTIRALRVWGVAVRAFTVDDPARALWLLAHGVAGVFTDRPDRLVPVLEGGGVGADVGGSPARPVLAEARRTVRQTDACGPDAPAGEPAAQ